MYLTSIDLYPSAPFNFDATLHKPDHFTSADNAWEPGIRWQTMRWHGTPLGLKFENRGNIDEPQVLLSIWSTGPLDQAYLTQLTGEISYRYNLQLDLSDFYRKFGADPYLSPVLTQWRGMRPMNYSSLYEYMMITIVLQNATVRRSVRMMQALYESYGTPLSYDGKDLYCYWVPACLAGVAEQELRDLKLGYRAKSILRVTQAFLQGDIDELELRRCSREEQRAALLSLYGIGPASVEYLLSDVFHYLDEMDHISPWEQKIYSKLFFDADPESPVPVEQLMSFFYEHFPGYRSLAVHYFWEDLFWKRKTDPVDWLEKLIRL